MLVIPVKQSANRNLEFELARHSGQTKCEPESRTKQYKQRSPTLLLKRISENEKRTQWGSRYKNKKTHQGSELVVSIYKAASAAFFI